MKTLGKNWILCKDKMKAILKINSNFSMERIDTPTPDRALIIYNEQIYANVNVNSCYWYLSGLLLGLELRGNK